jgi:hypothetical protein
MKRKYSGGKKWEREKEKGEERGEEGRRGRGHTPLF